MVANSYCFHSISWMSISRIMLDIPEVMLFGMFMTIVELLELVELRAAGRLLRGITNQSHKGK